MTSARRQYLEKTKTVSMPPIASDHQTQFPARPCLIIRPVTANGVSAAKVVATIEVPASHQGSERPETKYSSRLLPARPRNINPTATTITM